MASSKDMTAARPLAHRSPLSNLSATAPSRQGHGRTGSQTSHTILGASNDRNRVARRKSVNTGNANLAAVTAVFEGERSAAWPIAGRRNTLSRLSPPSPPASLPHSGRSVGNAAAALGGSAIDDGNDVSADDAAAGKATKAKARRASEGQSSKKSVKVELNCQQCGKAYKHHSCLTKHLWEHTPEWNVTSKYQISKHQQVQLLEAASVLIGMNEKPHDNKPATPPESTQDNNSEPESASPAASVEYSEPAERYSSVDSTPPPAVEGGYSIPRAYRSSSTFSRSYQSTPLYGDGMAFGHARKPSDARPPSAGVGNTNQEDRDLAQALVGCSVGSSNGVAGNGRVVLTDAPAVPRIPEQYLGQATSFNSNGAFGMSSFPSRAPESFTRGDFRRGSEDVKMGGDVESGIDDDDFDPPARTHSDDEDDGVFGSMEE